MLDINLDIILYIYLFIAFSMIIFNLFTVLGRNINNSKQEKLTNKFKELILEEIKNNKYDEEHYNLLCKKLKRTNNLLAYHAAILDISKDQEKKVHKYLLMYKNAFIYLVQVYRDKNTMNRGYFAYLMSEYKLCVGDESNYITEIMISFTQDSSIYVRENAMKALISFKNIDHIVNALRIINRLEYEYNRRVLTDDLLEFKDNIDELCDALVNSLDEFNEEIKLGIINYIAFVSDKYKEEFYKLFIDNNTSKEVKVGLIRYFAKHPSDKIVDELYKYLKSSKANDWELASVSAFALKKYKSVQTKKALIDALSSTNWYVRKNAADSLLSIGLTKKDLDKVHESKDKYAIEMIDYAMSRTKGDR